MILYLIPFCPLLLCVLICLLRLPWLQEVGVGKRLGNDRCWGMTWAGWLGQGAQRAGIVPPLTLKAGNCLCAPLPACPPPPRKESHSVSQHGFQTCLGTTVCPEVNSGQPVKLTNGNSLVLQTSAWACVKGAQKLCRKRYFQGLVMVRCERRGMGKGLRGNGFRD